MIAIRQESFVNGKNVRDYYITTPAELNSLPTPQTDKEISGASLCFITSTGQTAFLTDTGWEIPAWM